MEEKCNIESSRKKTENGKLGVLIAHLAAISSHFLKHSFIKREQAETFNSYDRPRALNQEFSLEAVLQIDFAENFVCVNQNEVQTAHWNQRQLTLFTSALYYNDKIQSKVYVSNNNNHDKTTIVPYIYKLLMDLPDEVVILKVWSDGPTSQFKNKYIAAMIPEFEEIRLENCLELFCNRSW